MHVFLFLFSFFPAELGKQNEEDCTIIIIQNVGWYTCIEEIKVVQKFTSFPNISMERVIRTLALVKCAKKRENKYTDCYRNVQSLSLQNGETSIPQAL